MIKRRKIYPPTCPPKPWRRGKLQRRRTKTVNIGAVKIGSRYPVSIQSMTKSDTADLRATLRQIQALEKAGCEIIRVAVKNIACAQAIDKIRAKINLPLVADIHFNYRLALEAIDKGADCLRLNPGNIYRREEVQQIARAAKRKGIPIRVGVNAGSLRQAKHKTQKAGLDDLMVKSADEFIKMLEGVGFYDIIVSLKASTVTETVSAYRKMAQLCNYPFHLGITACGLPEDGTIKSAMGIGALLLAGIGDTVRVSLTGNPEEEVRVAKEILQALGLRRFGPEIIACPTCGRAQVDVVKITRELSRKLNGIQPLKVAIMGCEVNGPGEARDADIGFAGGKKSGILFKKGRIVKKVAQAEAVEALLKEIRSRNGR